MAKEIILKPAYSLREFRIHSRRTTIENIISKINLKTKLCRKVDDFFYLNMPLISAAMQAVSGTDMAIALAQHGGMGVIPCSIPVEEQVRIIKDVKRYKAGFQKEVICFAPYSKIDNVIDTIKKTGYSIFPVTEDGSSKSKLVGIITDKDFIRKYKASPVSDYMVTHLDVAYEGIGMEEANELIIKYHRGFLPIVDKDFNLKSVVFKKDLEKSSDLPYELTDDKKRYCVAAAVSTQPKDRERIDALCESGLEAIFIDASDGYSDFQAETLDYIKSISDIPVIGGNIITYEGFMHLAKAGFDGVKVGMGIGSGCTTQETKGTGRGQAAALMDAVKARDDFYRKTGGTYIPIIADGGISSTAHMAVALAIGADSLMMGRYFVQYRESAAPLIRHKKHGFVKEYWMEASARARNYGRYDSSKDIFFEEGTEGYVPCIGSIHERKNLPETLLKIKSAMSTAGCSTIDEMHREAILELQSVYSLADGAVHDMILK